MSQRAFQKELERKLEAVLIESNCTYKDAQAALTSLCDRYRWKKDDLADVINIREIAKAFDARKM